MRVLVLAILFFICLAPVFAQSLEWEMRNTVMTTNPDPVNFPVSSYQDYLAQLPPSVPSRAELVNTKVAEGAYRANFMVIVEAGIYSSISASISTYQNDLANEAFTTYVVTWTGNSAVDMKAYIHNAYTTNGIVGVMLVGNLPVAWYEYQTLNDEGELTGIWDDFPCELYFADMDGTWTDADGDGKYDLHTNGTHPEIWISRVRADNLPTTGQGQAALITSYFARNHQHRTGASQGSNQALVYVDDDWQSAGNGFQQEMRNLYVNTELVNTSAETNAPDYRDNRLPSTYEFIQVMAHSSPTHHNFKVVVDDVETSGNVLSSELPNRANSKFYNLFACSNARFTDSNCMGSVYLLGNNYTLNVVGTAKTGSMLNFAEFYYPLSQQQSFGNAYKNWWAEAINNNQASYHEIHWFYGNLLLGDCSLRVRYSPGGVAWTGSYSTEWNHAANWSNGIVPGADNDIFIPADVPRFPANSMGTAQCRNLQIAGGASLDLYQNLYVYGELSSWGTVTLYNSGTQLLVAGNAMMGDGSVVNTNFPSAQLYFSRDLTILSGADFTVSAPLIFGGPLNSFFTNHNANTSFGDLLVQKTAGSSLILSASGSQRFKVNGNVLVYSTAALMGLFNGTVEVQGNIVSLNTTASGFSMMNGTIELPAGPHTITLPHTFDRINHLLMKVNSSVTWTNLAKVGGDLTSESATVINVPPTGFTVEGNCMIGGNLAIGTDTGDLIVGGKLTFNSGSTATITSPNADIKCTGSVEFKNGSNIVMTQGYLEFTGPGTSSLLNYSAVTEICHLKNNKEAPGYLDISVSGSSGIKINGNIWNYQSRKMTCSFSGTTVLIGNFTSYNSSSDGIRWQAGTLRLNGTNQSISFANSADFINNLGVFATGLVQVNSPLTLQGNYSQISGTFRPGANLVKIGGSFLIVSPGVFDTANSTVQFFGTAAQEINSSFGFNILQLNKASGNLTVNSGVTVTAQSFKYYSGTLRVMGGTFTATDMADNGIMGSYTVSSGILNLNQDSGQVIDMDASITMNGGAMNITGGYGLAANWAVTRAIQITMSGGVLTLPSQGVNLSSTGYNIGLNLSGGTIRTAGSFLIQRAGFNPGGGTIELYGPADCQLGCVVGSSFANLLINKSSTREDGPPRVNSASLYSDANVTGSLTVQSGQLSVGSWTLTVEGPITVYSGLNMTSSTSVINCHGVLTLDATSSSQFTAGNLNIYFRYEIMDGAVASFGTTHSLNFRGGLIQMPVCQSSTVNFRNVTINKTANFVHFAGSASQPNYFSYFGTLNLMSGNTLRLYDYSVCAGGTATIDGTLNLSANSDASFITLNHNALIQQTGGSLSVAANFSRGTGSTLTLSGGQFTVNTPYSGTLYWLNGSTAISGGSLAITNNGMQLGSGCTFSQTGGEVKIGWNFKTLTSNVFLPTGGSVVFTGSRNGSVDLAAGNSFFDLGVNKSSLSYSFTTASNILINNDLSVQGGVFAPSASYSCSVFRDVLISGGRLDAGALNQTLRVGRNWQNTAGPDAFTEGLGAVEFYSYQMSVIGSESFNRLRIDKGYAYTQRASIPAGALVNVAADVYVGSGCLGIEGGGILDIAEHLVIETDAGLSYAPSTGIATLRLGGDLENYNTSTSQTVGIWANVNSLMIVDGPGDQSLVSDAPYIYAGTFQVIKPSGIANVWVPLQCKGDFILNAGSVVFPTTGSLMELYGGLSLAAGTSLDTANDTIKFFGTANAAIDSYITIPVTTVYVTKTAPAYVELTRNLVFSGMGSITVNSGELRVNSYDFTPSGNINVTTGAKLVLGPGSTLRMSPSSTISVYSTSNPHSRLVAIGTSTNPARITCRTGYYAINIENYATVQARYTIFEKLGTNGLNFGQRTAIDPADPLAFCTFRQGIAGGSLITSISTGVMTVPNAVFENTHPATSLYNVSKTAGATITFVNATGNFSGEAYDYDPSGLVVWETTGPPPVPQNLVIAKVASGIQVSWNASAGATTYRIYRSLLPDSAWVQAGSTGNTSWIDLAPPEPKAFYRVTAE